MFEIHSEESGASVYDLASRMWHDIGRRYYYGHEVDNVPGKVLSWDTIKAFITLSNIYGADVTKDIFATWVQNEYFKGFTAQSVISLFTAKKSNSYAHGTVVQAKPGAYPHCRNIDFDGAVTVCMKDLEPSVNFDWRQFKAYFLEQSLEEGYADSLSEFLTTWADTLYMQLQVYGKITDKYPECLTVTHNKLSFMCRIRSVQIDEKNFSAAIEKAKGYEGDAKDLEGTKWKLIAPTCRQDILDEASQMSNCVASYVTKMTEGRCTIMFLRKADEPNKSVCTVEVSPAGQVVQFKARRNTAPSDNARHALNQICTGNDMLYDGI
jgi:hypothetical protein